PAPVEKLETMPKEKGTTPPKSSEKPKGTGQLGTTSATLVVNLPAEAKLLIDGYVTKSTSATRVFTSPTLEPGQKFAYTLQRELVRDGRTLTATKQVVVQAGQEIRVDLDFAAVTVAQK